MKNTDINTVKVLECPDCGYTDNHSNRQDLKEDGWEYFQILDAWCCPACSYDRGGELR